MVNYMRLYGQFYEVCMVPALRLGCNISAHIVLESGKACHCLCFYLSFEEGASFFPFQNSKAVFSGCVLTL